MPRFRGIALLAVTCAVAVASVGCGQTAPTVPQAGPSDLQNCDPLSPTATVKLIVAAKISQYAPVLLAQEFGEFQKQGLNVEVSYVPSADALSLVAQGKNDIMAASLTAGVLNAMESGISLGWVAPAGTTNPDSKRGLWVRKELAPNGKLDPKLLKGKTIGSQTGLGGIFSNALAEVLATANLTLNDITYKKVPNADMPTALKNGAIDAGFVADPFWLPLGQDPNLVFAPTPDSDVFIGYFAGPSFLSRPDVLVAFERAVLNTINNHLQGNYLNNAETLAALKKTLDQGEDTLKAVPPPVFETKPAFDVGQRVASMQANFISAGKILDYSTALPADKVVNPAFVQAAVKCNG